VTDIQAPPAHRTLASELRWVRANLPGDTAMAVTRALDAAAERAEREHTQAQIWHGEAQQREAAQALLERVPAELDRLTRLLPDPPGDLARYVEGAAWAIGELRAALDTDQLTSTESAR